MNRRHALWLRLLLVFLPFIAIPGHADTQVLPAQAFDLLLSFEGDWIDVDGSLGMQDEVAVSYRATANRSTVIESIFVDQPYEMVTVFHRDQDQIALTHYCSLGNQPRMHSVAFEPNQVEFSFSGGSGFDPEKDRYMHSRIMGAASADELYGDWQEYVNGAATEEMRTRYRLRRAE